MTTKNTYTNALAVASVILATALSQNSFATEANGPDTEAFGSAVPDATLANSRGGYTVQTSTNNLTATLEHNQALSNVTGNNSVASGAFAGTSGFATVVQNSGNNVIIQNSTILNLEMK